MKVIDARASRLSMAVAFAGASLACQSSMAADNRTETPPSATGWKAAVVTEGIEHPWGIAWLPDGRALVTSRPGKLFLIEGGERREVAMEGLPQLFTENQAGLLDVAVHPRGGDKPLVYLTLATGTTEKNRTTLVRGTFDGSKLTGIETLFQVTPDKSEGQHFGSRLLWLDDGTLLMSIGDGGNPPLRIDGMLARDQAQNLKSHLGSIVRLTEDGKPAEGNPFAGQADALPEIWSYGHRNIQGLARDPETGAIWANEHGPRGGDELNRVRAGLNYGWPLQTFGVDYQTGEPIGATSVEGAVDPAVVWIPATAPSGLAFYAGKHFPAWRGSLFSGGLVTEDVRRITVDGDGNATERERLEIGNRVRDVKLGPDGYLYVLTDEEKGQVLRIEPSSAQ